MTGILRAVSQTLVVCSRRRISTAAPCVSTTVIRTASFATTPTTTLTTTTRRSNNNALLLQQRQRPQLLQLPHHRNFSWNQERGYDLTADMMAGEDGKPKVTVEAYAPTGFDVRNTVRCLDETEKSDGIVHMNGSILLFPYGCFLWKVETAEDVTVESLSPILLHRPKLDYLFIGCNRHGGKGGISQEVMKTIQNEMGKHGIAVEQLTLGNAIGTFNILNAEDRLVAAALIIDPVEDPEVIKYAQSGQDTT